MSKELPDYQDADLILRLYDMRRETVMRQSRDKLFREFWPKSFEDVQAVTGKPENPLNVCYRQVSSYWEMAAGLVKHGILNPDLFAENCAEGLYLLSKVLPFLPRMRETAPTTFQNIEWVVQNSAEARKRFEVIQARVKSMTK
jgi:hypothetical protein